MKEMQENFRAERQAVTHDLLRKRILFVDDEAGIRLTLAHILGKFGFEVTSAASVNEAVKEIKAHKFDALLSDLNLPLANEGFVVIRAMRRHQPRCVNFVLTGSGDARMEKAIDQQVAHYFTKPVDIRELVGTIMDKLCFCDPKVIPQTRDQIYRAEAAVDTHRAATSLPRMPYKLLNSRKQVFRFLALQQPSVYSTDTFVQNRTVARQHHNRHLGIEALQSFGYIKTVHISHPIIDHD